MENRKIGYGSYWVAYFDLLGFANRVRVMPTVWPILEEYRTVLAEIRKNPEEIRSKWFSDTFLFYTPDDSEKSFAGIDAACQFFFYRMTRSHIPVRGSLTVGDFYEDTSDGVLVGPALIDAYKLAERQDWLGFVLSPDAVRRREQYGFPRDYYREYDVPVDHSKSTERLEAFIISHDFPPDQLWKCIDDMEGVALTMIEAENSRGEKAQSQDTRIEDERNRILRKYRNTKGYLLHIAPWLADCVEDKYGAILLNKPEVRRIVREHASR